MTDPLVPACIDLRDFPDMPLTVRQLVDSDLMSQPDAVFRLSVISWSVSWHQLPAGSLPSDDVALARLLGFGRSIKALQKMREAGALRGWLPCSDGRLYHPVVAEKVKKAWAFKTRARSKRERDAERLRLWRLSKGQIDDETNIETPVETSFVAKRQERILSDRIGKESGETPAASPIPPNREPSTGLILTPGPKQDLQRIRDCGVKIWRDDEGAWLRLRKLFGLDALCAFLETARPEDRKDHLRVETLLTAQRRSQAADHTSRVKGDALQEKYQQEEAAKREMIAKNKASVPAWERIANYLQSDDVDQGNRDQYSDCTVLTGALKALAQNGRGSAVSLAFVLSQFPELERIAHPNPVTA